MTTTILSLFATLAILAASIIATCAVLARIAHGPVGLARAARHVASALAGDVAYAASLARRAAARLESVATVASNERAETLAIDMSRVLDAGPTRCASDVAARIAATDADDAPQTVRLESVDAPLWREVGGTILYLGD